MIGACQNRKMCVETVLSDIDTQSASKLIIETLEKNVKYVQN